MDNIERLKKRTGEEDESVLEDLLFTAKNTILRRRYQCVGITASQIYDEELPEEYYDLQYRMAYAMWLKRGADFETQHSANGVARQWNSDNIPKSLLAEVVPLCSPIR